MFDHKTVGAAPTKKLTNIVIHFRRHKNGQIATREGRTLLIKRTPDKLAFDIIEARCGKRDVFSRKIGRAIVEGRDRKGMAWVRDANEVEVLTRLRQLNERYRERYSFEFFKQLLSRLA